MSNPKSRAARDAAHRATVRRNEDEVIAGALQLDPADQGDKANYIREAADDIIARRAAGN